MKAIFGNKLAPSFADHYLARMGYGAQQYDGPENPNRPNNLWTPVPGDHGAHGKFDDRARTASLELWSETHASMLAMVVLGAAAGVALAMSKKPWLSHIKQEIERRAA